MSYTYLSSFIHYIYTTKFFKPYGTYANLWELGKYLKKFLRNKSLGVTEYFCELLGTSVFYWENFELLGVTEYTGNFC
jgi:hypothetical protein